MDPESYLAAHAGEWAALDRLIRRARRPRRMSAAELDDLVVGYQRAAAQLSQIRTSYPDPALIDRLSALVTRGRAAVTGSRDRVWSEVGRFLAVTFPAAVYVRRWWCLATAAASLGVAVALGIWVVHDPAVRDALVPPGQVRQLVDHDFAAYYRSAPAADFAAHVWTNNAVVAAAALTLGVLLGAPTVFVLLQNAINLGVSGGLLIAAGRSTEFWVLILPHGMLELTAVFVAGATGLRLGWRVVDPGALTRTQALAEEGRSAVVIALGLIAVLAVSGVLEAFVTPSGLPAWARLGLGGLAEVGFVGFVSVRGRNVVRSGRTIGDLDEQLVGSPVPVV